MADLMTALRNADAAGDTDAAARIAAMIEEQNAQGSADGEVVSGGAVSEVPAGAADSGGAPSISGGLDILAAGAVGTVESATKGIAGLIARKMGASPEAQEDVQDIAGEAFPDYEIGPDGQAIIEVLTEKYGEIAPEFVKDLVSGLSTADSDMGKWVQDVTGSPGLAAAAHTIPAAIEAAATLGGMGAARRGISEGVKVANTIPEVQEATALTKGLFQYQSPTKQKIAQLLKEGSTDAETALYDLVKAGDGEAKAGMAKTLGIGGPKVAVNEAAKEAIHQGFDEGVIAAVKGASKADNTAFRKMVDVMQRGKRNKLYAQSNRPSDVAGETLMGYVRQVQKANRDAGKKIDEVASNLKGDVDFQPAINTFVEKLQKMGVSLARNEKGDLKANFNGSDIQGLSGPENVINRVVKRLSEQENIDAYSLHQLKRYLDEQVTFGKSAEGLGGKTERLLKDLRHDIDDALDKKFPEYDEVNTQYAETIGALDALQDVAGQKMDLKAPDAPKAIGTLMRRVMGNAQSRVPLMRAMVDVEAMAKKYGGKMGDQKLIEGPVHKGQQPNLLNQILFADELDDVFSPVARSSLRGELASNAKAAARAGRTAAGGMDIAIDLLGAGYDKVRGVNPEKGFTAIRELLKQK